MSGQRVNGDVPRRQTLRHNGCNVAYMARPGKTDGGPCIVFLPGFRSRMDGLKGTFLDAHCAAKGFACVRFDYFGHGQSDGTLEQGTLGRWIDDTLGVIDHLASGPVIVVGSSMGGWIGIHAARLRSAAVFGLVTIAAAADFTRDLLPALLGKAGAAALDREGVAHLPSRYDDGPYAVTRTMLDESAAWYVLNAKQRLRLGCPIRLLHGMADPDVPWQRSMELVHQLEDEDVVITLIKDGDHRLSRPSDLRRLAAAVDDVADQVSA